MEIFYSDKHFKQQGRAELNDGKLMPCFENPLRLQTILEVLQQQQIGPVKSPECFSKSLLEKIHHVDYLQFLQTAWDEWYHIHGDIDALPLIWPVRGFRQIVPDHIDGKLSYYAMDAGTPITAGTYDAVMAAVDVTLSAQKAIYNGANSAFALCRPPGHHASQDCYGGYCFINNAAVAAQAAIAQGMQRVAILDIDYHHGNGTQSIFYDRDDVLFISIHADPKMEFPYFLGYEDEKGTGKGQGLNINFPLPWGTGFDNWHSALIQALKAIKVYDPEMLIVSLGLDTYEGDPISEFKLKTLDYLQIGKSLSKMQLPTLFVMEGGYAVEALGLNTFNVLKGFDN